MGSLTRLDSLSPLHAATLCLPSSAERKHCQPSDWVEYVVMVPKQRGCSLDGHRLCGYCRPNPLIVWTKGFTLARVTHPAAPHRSSPPPHRLQLSLMFTHKM